MRVQKMIARLCIFFIKERTQTQNGNSGSVKRSRITKGSSDRGSILHHFTVQRLHGYQQRYIRSRLRLRLGKGGTCGFICLFLD